MKDDSDITTTLTKYRATLARYIRSIVKPQDIDDIVQEAFAKSYETELKQKIEFPRTYMLRTVRNLALNHVNKWDNKFSTSLEDFSESSVNLTSHTLEREFESKERFLIFCRAVGELPRQCRKVFVLKKVYSLKQKEIADYLGITEGTVEKHVAKAMLHCIEYMERIDADSSRTEHKAGWKHGSK